MRQLVDVSKWHLTVNRSPSKRARVFVGNIAPQVRSAELKEKFEEFGTIRQCDLKG